MRIHTGNHTDRAFRIHQAANDWLSVDFLDEWGGADILGPDQVECSEEEWLEIRKIAGGSFASEWMWADGRIVAS